MAALEGAVPGVSVRPPPHYHVALGFFIIQLKETKTQRDKVSGAFIPGSAAEQNWPSNNEVWVIATAGDNKPGHFTTWGTFGHLCMCVYVGGDLTLQQSCEDKGTDSADLGLI